MDRLADAEWFASSGLSASAAQTLYPRHSSSVFSPLRCLLFATPILLFPTSLFLASLPVTSSFSSSFRKSLKASSALRCYLRLSFAASRGSFEKLGKSRAFKPDSTQDLIRTFKFVRQDSSFFFSMKISFSSILWILWFFPSTLNFSPIHHWFVNNSMYLQAQTTYVVILHRNEASWLQVN